MARSIRMPGQEELPDSARRRLVQTLHRYYELAGRPTLRTIEQWIDRRGGRAASKETVRRMLVGISVPLRWEIAETAFLALCALAGRDPDERCDDRREDGDRRPIRTLRDDFLHKWQAVVAGLSPRSRRPSR